MWIPTPPPVVRLDIWGFRDSRVLKAGIGLGESEKQNVDDKRTKRGRREGRLGATA